MIVHFTNPKASKVVKIAASRFKGIPQAFLAADVMAAAGAKKNSKQVTAPLSAFRHLDYCPELPKLEKALSTKAAMHRHTNTAALRGRTIPAPCCFPEFYSGRKEKGHDFDADSFSFSRVPEVKAPVKKAAKKVARKASAARKAPVKKAPAKRTAKRK